jgi:hypothetical protein
MNKQNEWEMTAEELGSRNKWVADVAHAAQVKMFDWQESPCTDASHISINKGRRKHRNCLLCQNTIREAMKGEGR